MGAVSTKLVVTVVYLMTALIYYEPLRKNNLTLQESMANVTYRASNLQ
jgi:hypothetical protein